MKAKSWCCCTSVLKIDFDFLKNSGIEWILLDLDNTLDSPYSKEPSASVYEFGKMVKAAGLNCGIISNNWNVARASSYAQAVQAKFFLFSAGKPFVRRVKRCLKQQGIKPEKSLFCGDQLLTDRMIADKLKIRFCLVKPISNKEPFFTLFNRLFELPLRTLWARHGLFGTFFG